jgi:hypothetical protein
MIQLLVIKTFFKKVWTWLKHNWKVPLVLIYTIALWVFFRQKDKAREVLEVRAESYEAQIAALNTAHAEEIKKRNEILKQYTEIVEELERTYTEDRKELDSKKKKEVKKIVEKYYNRPDELARELADKFNFEYKE